MPSTLILDSADPEVADIVNQWQEGGQYQVTLSITQGKTTGTKTQFMVDAITDYGEAGAMESEEEGEESLGEPMPTPKKPSGPQALMILVGQKKKGSVAPTK